MRRQLRSIGRRVARASMRSDWLWHRVQHSRHHDFFAPKRKSILRKRARHKCAELLSRLEVLGGPFAGMRYAEAGAVGSSIWPKLLGTYESEIRGCLTEILSRPYRRVIDVGFAEGFYLIGLGRLLNNAALIGFDIESDAARLCRENARANDIPSDRLQLHGGFDRWQFIGELASDSLVVVDCEGYENQVIAGLDPGQLSRADWLIETHDHLVTGTSERLAAALAETHQLLVIPSDETTERKRALLPPEIRQACDPSEQSALLDEDREGRQTWLYAKRLAA